MAKYVIRPRFRFISNLEKQVIFDRLLSLSDNKSISTQLISNRVKLSISKEMQEYWSPILTISIEPTTNDDELEIKCLIGPKENVWLMFVFIYGAAAMTFLFGGLMSLSELSLGIYSPLLLSLPISVLLVVFTFIAAKIGQKKGYNQMMLLINSSFEALEVSNSEKEMILS